MPVLNVHDVENYLYFDETECRDAGERLSAAYRAASPFPHAVIDDFLDPGLLRRISAGYPTTTGKNFFDRDHERLKYQFHPSEASSAPVRNLLAELNGQAMIAFVEAISGIQGLIPDPFFLGGGLHETRRGGHLSVHADFNIHGRMKLERRLNLLIYLNDDWDPSFGGNLELWDRGMNGCERSIAPLIGRAVLFNTALDSYHGHPDPLACPPERSRRSIALYYYTAFEHGVASAPRRTTNFKQRPGSAERIDWRVRCIHFVNDWVPHRLQPLAKRVIARF